MATTIIQSYSVGVSLGSDEVDGLPRRIRTPEQLPNCIMEVAAIIKDSPYTALLDTIEKHGCVVLKMLQSTEPKSGRL